MGQSFGKTRQLSPLWPSSWPDHEGAGLSARKPEISSRVLDRVNSW